MDSDDPPDTQPDGGVPGASEDAVAARVGDDAVAGTLTTPDGRDIPVALSEDIVEQAREHDVDPSRLRDAVAGADVPDDFDFDLTPRAGRVRAQDDSATIPVQDRREALLGSSRVSDFDFIQDPQIRKLQQNSIDYNHRIGRFLLAKDDLIPSVKERIKALIVGSDGLDVEPANPDDDADQRLADHLQDLYDDDVRPTDVIDAILRENLMHARAVLRATDLEELDLRTLDYLKDGISGEEIYMQDPTTVYEFDVEEGSRDDPGDIDVTQRRMDAQPLVIGEQVFDIGLYDEPPLEAVADTAVNKMVMQRLKARKAELTSFGAVYAKVEPPSYLPEDQYFDRVQDDDFDDDGQPPTKLERALRQNMQSAFDHLKDWQSGTTMAIPDYWSLEQIDIPESGTPLDEQIRGYNRSIARRMLVPLDLIELREGAELSRETLFRTLMTTVQGWRAEILRVFDQFAQTQKEIHDLNGDVEHSFPPIQNQDEKLVVQALQYAGIAGLTEKEVRQMLNQVEGINLDTDSGPSQPQPPGQDQPAPPGGPQNPQDRADQMQDFLNQQNDRGRDDAGGEPAADDGGDGSTRPASAAADSVSDLDLTPPQQAQDNAQKVLDWKDDPDKDVQGMTKVGWNRARQLADGQELSPQVVKKMAQFNRHRQNSDVAPEHEGTPWRDAGRVAWLGWGGDAGIDWAIRMSDRIQDIQGQQAGGSGNAQSTPATARGPGSTSTPGFGTTDAVAANRYQEGDKVEVDGSRGVVTEVWTSGEREGPDGDTWKPTANSPVYIVATVDGATAAKASDIEASDWSTGQDDPAGDLAQQAQAADVDWANGDVDLEASRFNYPDTWKESDIPARLILLDAWASMGGQFDCGGGCCHGEMTSSGMTSDAADEFCASMKDRVLGGWEGWRKGG